MKKVMFIFVFALLASMYMSHRHNVQVERVAVDSYLVGCALSARNSCDYFEGPPNQDACKEQAEMFCKITSLEYADFLEGKTNEFTELLRR